MENKALSTLSGANRQLTADRQPTNTTDAEFERDGAQAGLNLHDIIFILFRHKWKILLCATVGIVAAASLYFLLPPQYESEAKLFVRYVVDKSAVDGLESQVKLPGPSQTDTLLNSEIAILTSSDLASEVAEAIGIERLLPGSGGKATKADAAHSILRGLNANALPGSDIISVSYRNDDPKLPMPVLQELVKRYFDKHLEVHRSVGAFDFVTRETAQLQTEMSQTDEELKQLKSRLGVVSLAETKATLAAELLKSEGDLDTAKAEFAAQQALVKELEKSRGLIVADRSADANQSDSHTGAASGEVVQKYQSLVDRITQLQQAETELSSKFTPENRLVKVKKAQIADLEKQRSDLEKKHPALIDTAASSSTAPVAVARQVVLDWWQHQGTHADLAVERAHLAGFESRVQVLGSNVTNLRERAKELSESGPRIEELERKKDVEEANYKHFQASLQKARIDEALDPSRMPNISIVQTPSPAVRATRDIKKFVLGLAGGGFAVGIAIAMLIELLLDRTIKRPLELERRLRIPLLLSIPHLGQNAQRLRLLDGRSDSELVDAESEREDLAPNGTGESLLPFCEAIRDRLDFFFRLNNMAHRPKLIAVTGLSNNAGASTLAAGLANALSDGTDGKVLLVDKPVAIKRFYNMLKEFKASSLDYVVFDMPAVGDTSATVPLAGLMDTVLLVVEAEKTNREAVKRAYAQLAAKTEVSVVFNKMRSYGPRWLEAEV